MSKKNIAFRPITEADTENILRWRNSDLVVPFFNYQKEVTKEDHFCWIEEKVKTGEVYQFIIHDGLIDADVGTVYIQNIDRINSKAEYGIFIGEREALGHGIGTTAAKFMIDFAFNELKLHRIYLQVHSDNERAIRSYEKAGFKQEARLVDDVFVNGDYCDLIIMGIVNEERE